MVCETKIIAYDIHYDVFVNSYAINGENFNKFIKKYSERTWSGEIHRAGYCIVSINTQGHQHVCGCVSNACLHKTNAFACQVAGTPGYRYAPYYVG